MDEGKIIRILVVDDHEVVRRGLVVSLSTFADFNIIGQAADGEEAVRLCDQLRPDLILMDVMMSPMDGPTATRLIHQNHPEVLILALTTFKEESMVRDMLKSGARGYLLKNTTMDELAYAIRAAASGRITLSPEAADILLEPSFPHSDRSFNLTERELEVLALMVDGLNNVEIAQRMVVARSTVKFHVSSILAKLNVGNRVDAVRIALQSGLIKN